MERRQIVEETLKSDASVARVARAHEVNANQVHCWRALYRRGLLGGATAATAATAALVPVTVTAPALVQDGGGFAAPGAIHVQLRRARLRIEGAVDLAALRAVLEALGG